MRRGRRLDWAGGGRRVLAALAGLMVALFALDVAFPPPLARVEAVSPVVLDKDGVWLRAFLTPAGRWCLEARLADIDPEFRARLVRIEDRRFWVHPGIDPLALARAGAGYAATGAARSGASTLTMQLARLLEPRPRTIASKLIEMVRALQIERRWTKARILSAYLTLAPYGGNLEGVRAASRAYFGRDPRALNDAEMALLIALPQAPEARRPDRRPGAARAARDRVIAKFEAAAMIGPRLAAEARAAPVPGRTPFPARADLAAAHIARAHPGAVTVSTLDARLQEDAAALLRARAAKLGQGVTAAALVVELKGRRVRAAVGGTGRDRPGGFIDMTRAVRSPGSTLKPFIYALAFDDGFAAPETVVEDAPRRFGGYLPENFDRRFHGQVRVAEALQHSLNLPAVAMLERVGAGRFEAALTLAGARPRFPHRRTAEPGLALALGGVGLTLEELVTLYAALGDGGAARPLTYAGIPSGRSYRLMRAETAEKVLSILARSPSPAGRAPGRLTLAAPHIAFKTGTSYGFRDSWALGLAGGYAAGVWVGRPDGAARPGASGRSEALPLLFDLFDQIVPLAGHAPIAEPQREPKAAPGLAKLERSDSGPAILFPPDRAEILAGPRGVALAARGGAAPLTWYAEGDAVPQEPTSGRAVWVPSGEGFFEVRVVDAQGRSAKARVRVRGGA